MENIRNFKITYAETGFYFVDNRRVDSDINTVCYFIRHMCGFDHAKRPSHHLIRRACRSAKADPNGSATLTVPG